MTILLCTRTRRQTQTDSRNFRVTVTELPWCERRPTTKRPLVVRRGWLFPLPHYTVTVTCGRTGCHWKLLSINDAAYRLENSTIC